MQDVGQGCRCVAKVVTARAGMQGRDGVSGTEVQSRKAEVWLHGQECRNAGKLGQE